MTAYEHWADALTLRQEITDAAGQIADLQMSLYSAVYTDRDVPYQDPGYYADITEPTVGLLRFFGSIARRLGVKGPGGKALFHLDQGMGGGKSHALVGLYHLANASAAFLATELGQLVKAEAEQSGGPTRPQRRTRCGPVRRQHDARRHQPRVRAGYQPVRAIPVVAVQGRQGSLQPAPGRRTQQGSARKGA